MKIFDVLFNFLLFLKITSGLKCHECSDLSGGKSCSSLRRFSNKDCDLPISKNERAVCKSSWKEGSIYISECSVVSVDEETGCCFKGGPVNNRTICTCDTDFCIDKPESNSIINRCKKDAHEVERDSGLKCYECNNVVGHSCTSLNKATKRDCSQPSSGERSVCKSSWKDGEIYNSECSVAPLKEASGCCLKNGNRISCTCDTDFCIENPGTNSLKLEQCGNDDSRNKGLLCYTCRGNDCIDLTTAPTSYCPEPVDDPFQKLKAVCETIFIHKRDNPIRVKCGIKDTKQEAGCCIVDRARTDCSCDTDLCINDNKPPTTALCGTGLKCYDCILSECNNLATASVTHCGVAANGDVEKVVCKSIWKEGVWTSTYCDVTKSNEKLDCCVEEVKGVIQTRCTCDTDLCTNDGSAVIKICESSTGLKCYDCNSRFHECEKLNAKVTAFCGLPDPGQKSVCKTEWDKGTLEFAYCASVKIDEKTDCCDKSYTSDTEYSCACTSDLCLGDGSGKITEQCDPTPRLKCPICHFGEDCTDLAMLPKHECENPKDPNERAVCVSRFSRRKHEDVFACGSARKSDNSDCCDDMGYKIFCTCTTNLCIGDGQGGDGKSTECPFRGLKCYECHTRDTCKDLTTVDKRFCSGPADWVPSCQTIWNEAGELTYAICDRIEPYIIDPPVDCCYEDKTKRQKKCYCSNRNFCLGDGTGKTIQRCDPVNSELQNLKLKCYVCNNAADCADLDTASLETCDRKGPGLNGNDELKHVCESTYEKGILQSVQCKTVDLKAITDCCAKDFCSCSKDKCLGDGSGGTVGPERPCKCGICGPKDVECYICGGAGQPSCGDGNVDIDTPRKICEPGQVCYSERDKVEDTIKRSCYTRINNERVGRCKSFRNLYSCLCDNMDLCLGDGFRNDVILTTLAPGITCFQCNGDCDDLDKINKEVCRIDEVCYTVAKDGIITRRGCYTSKKYDIRIGSCVRTDEADSFDSGIACFCDKELCIGDGNGDTGQKPAISYGLRCFDCGHRYQTPEIPLCEDSSNSKLCLRGEICLSEIHADGFRSRSCSNKYQFGPSGPKPGKCIPHEGQPGNDVGARCLCDNEDLCIGDGNGNDAQVTKGAGHGGNGGGIPNSGVLRCYECYNCDKVDGNTLMVPCPVGHCIKSTNDGIVTRSCGIFGTVGRCDDGICACNDKDGCNGSRGLTASASCSVGVAIFITYVNN